MTASAFLPDDGIIDNIAIKRALAGHRVKLRRAEAIKVLRRHLNDGGTRQTAAEIFGVSIRTLDRLIATRDDFWSAERVEKMPTVARYRHERRKAA